MFKLDIFHRLKRTWFLLPISNLRNWKQISCIALRWLALAVIGWLIYGLARALWAVIRLGMPWFDWQWYIAILALLAVLVTGLSWRWPHSRAGIAGTLMWIIIGYNGLGQDIRLYPAQAAPIPISFWSGAGVCQVPERVLEDVHAARGQLYLTIGKNEFTGENIQLLVDGVRRLAGRDIKVYLAPRASDFVSVPVHDEWIVNVQETAALIQREGLTNVRGIIGDVERPRYTPLDFWGKDRDAFFQAARDVGGLIEWMRKKHPDMSLGVTADWTLYLDSNDGDSDLSIIFRSSVNPPGHWDFINVMAYSSYFPSSWQAYYVYLVEQTMTRLHPDLPPSFLIGLIARGAPGERELDFDDLVRDAQLSRALGAREIVVYKLDGALKIYGDAFVQQLAAAVNNTQPDQVVQISFSRPASMLIYGVAVLDALLDARGWRGLLFLAWAVLSGLIAHRSDQYPNRPSAIQ